MASVPVQDSNSFPNSDHNSLRILTGVTNAYEQPFRIVSQNGLCYLDHLGDLYIFDKNRIDKLLVALGSEIHDKNWIMTVFNSFTPEQVDLNHFYRTYVQWLDWHELEVDEIDYIEVAVKSIASEEELTELVTCTNAIGKPLRYVEAFGKCYLDEHGDLYIIGTLNGFSGIQAHIFISHLSKENWIHEIYQRHNYLGSKRWDYVDMNDFFEAYIAFLEFNGFKMGEIRYQSTN